MRDWARKTAAEYYPKPFEEEPLRQEEYDKAVEGIRRGLPGHFRLGEEKSGMVLWRVFVRGTPMIARYDPGIRELKEFISSSGYKEDLNPFIYQNRSPSVR